MFMQQYANIIYNKVKALGNAVDLTTSNSNTSKDNIYIPKNEDKTFIHGSYYTYWGYNGSAEKRVENNVVSLSNVYITYFALSHTSNNGVWTIGLNGQTFNWSSGYYGRATENYGTVSTTSLLPYGKNAVLINYPVFFNSFNLSLSYTTSILQSYIEYTVAYIPKP